MSSQSDVEPTKTQSNKRQAPASQPQTKVADAKGPSAKGRDTSQGGSEPSGDARYPRIAEQRRKNSPGSATGSSIPQAPPAVLETVKELTELANEGDRDALKQLGQLLDDHPDIWQQAGDLSGGAEACLIELIAGDNQLVAESIKRRLAKMKEELAGPHPTPIEALLVDQIGASWLETRLYQTQLQNRSGSLGQAALQLKRMESAQKRFFSAIRNLTTVRALVPKGLVPYGGPHAYLEGVRRA